MNVVAVGLFQFFGVIALACIALAILAALIFTTAGRLIGVALIVGVVITVANIVNKPAPVAAQHFTFTPVVPAVPVPVVVPAVQAAPTQNEIDFAIAQRDMDAAEADKEAEQRPLTDAERAELREIFKK
jgi:hypothetical protein